MSKIDWFTPEGYVPVQNLRRDLENLGKNLSERDINKIIDEFWFRDTYSSFIALKSIYPKFLNFIIARNDSSFSRLNFYDYVYKGIRNRKGITQFSLEVETLGKNEYSSDEFSRLVKKTKLSKVNLLNANIVKETEDGITMVHHTITEYFVAKYILAQKDPIKEFKNRTFLITPDDKYTFFNISWYGVTLFLLDSPISSKLIDSLIILAQENPKVIEQNFSEVISHTKLNYLSEPQKNNLFDLIYESSKTSGVWISEWSKEGLSRIYTENKLRDIENDLLTHPTNLTDVIQVSNAVSILDQLISDKKIVDKEKLEELKNKFISYAKQRPDSGVLQRTSLSALVNYSDPKIIVELSKYFDMKSTGIRDELVNQAFLNLCYRIAPNEDVSINLYLEALSISQTKVYAWQGIKGITSDRGLLFFLRKLTDGKKYLDQLIDGENIFIKTDEGEEESPFVANLRKLSRSQKEPFLKLSQKIIIQATNLEHFYAFQNCIFIDKLLEISIEIHRGYLKDLLQNIPKNTEIKKTETIYGIAAHKLTGDNYLEVYKLAKKAKININLLINYTRNIEIKNKMLSLEGREQIVERKYTDPKRSIRQRTLREFHKKLRPKSKDDKTFMTDVFSYYLQTKDTLGNLTSKDRNRLTLLSYTYGLKKLNPKSFRLHIDNYLGGKQFTWSPEAEYFGKMVKVASILLPRKDIIKYKARLINFIPFSYSDDLTNIVEIVKTITEIDIKGLNEIFTDKSNDRRYLNPESYIRFVTEMKKNGSKIFSPKDVLISFIGDNDRIEEYVQTSAIEALCLFTSSDDEIVKKLLKKIERGRESMSSTATESLIKIYRDRISIKKRFEQIMHFGDAPLPTRISGEANVMSPAEIEFLDLNIAKILFELKDVTFVTNFLNLLKSSLCLSNNPGHEEYSRYINKIVFTYFVGIACKNNYNQFKKLARIVSKNKSIYWNYKLPELETTFLSRKDLDDNSR